MALWKKYKTEFGNLGEKLAEDYLSKKGFKIIDRKYKCFIGEIDLIAEKDDMLVFVEVKTRKDSSFDPLESVTFKKQKKLSKIAQYYSQKLKKEIDMRFDVVGITTLDGKVKIEHIENAFFVV